MSLSQALDASQAAETIRVGAILAKQVSSTTLGFDNVNPLTGDDKWYAYQNAGTTGYAFQRNFPTWNANIQYATGSVVRYDPGGGARTYIASGSPLAGVVPPGAGWTEQTLLAGNPLATAPNLLEIATQALSTGGITQNFCQAAGQPSPLLQLTDNGSGVRKAKVDGVIQAEGLSVNNAFFVSDPAISTVVMVLGQDYYPNGTGGFQLTSPGNPRPTAYGGGNWPAFVPGQTTVYTKASDLGALPIVQRANASGQGGAVCGTLSVAGRDGVSFVVVSLDATNTNPGTDTGYFNWILFNPNWS